MIRNRQGGRWRPPQRASAAALRASRFLRCAYCRPLRTLAIILMLILALSTIRLIFQLPSLKTGETAGWWPEIDGVEDGQGFSGCLPQYFPFCSPTNQTSAAREPMPVLLFAGVSHLTHGSFFAASLVQVALDLAIAVCVYGLACEVASRSTALLAVLLWALYLPAIGTEIGQVTGNLLAALCTTAGAYFFVRARRTGRAWEWLAAGGCFGLATLSRSALASIALILSLGLLIAALPMVTGFFRSVRGVLAIMIAFGVRALNLPLVRAPGTSLRRSLRPAVLFVLAFSVTISPWMVRNAVVFGRPVLGSTLTGYNLYRENSQLPTGHYLHFVAGTEADQAVASLFTRRTDLTGKETEAQMDAVYREEALRIIEAYPARYALLSLARLPMLWFNWTVPQGYGMSYGLHGYLYACQQALLLLAALWGTKYLRRQAWPLVGTVAAVTLVNMLVIGRLYLLFPVMPLVIILAAAGCAAIGRHRFHHVSVASLLYHSPNAHMLTTPDCRKPSQTWGARCATFRKPRCRAAIHQTEPS